MILADTCVLIDYLRHKPQAVDFIDNFGKSNIALSNVVIIELFKGVRNSREYRALKSELQNFAQIEIDNKVSALAIKLADTYALSHQMGLGDTLIAATALVYDLELKTYNLRDFRFIPTLKVNDNLTL